LNYSGFRVMGKKDGEKDRINQMKKAGTGRVFNLGPISGEKLAVSSRDGLYFNDFFMLDLLQLLALYMKDNFTGPI